MTKENQIKFVKNLFGSVQEDIVDFIENGLIPEKWEGQELRQLICDRTNVTVDPGRLPISERRKRDYKNHVTINYLV